MKRILIVILLALPLWACAQPQSKPLSKHQSRARLVRIADSLRVQQVVLENVYPEGYMLVGRVEGSRTQYGVMDFDGRMLMPCMYDAICGLWNDGLCAVAKDSLVGFVNSRFEWVVAPKYQFELEEGLYEDISLGSGLYVVMQHDKYGLIDSTGREVMPCQYDYLYPIGYKDWVLEYRGSNPRLIDFSGNEVPAFSHLELEGLGPEGCFVFSGGNHLHGLVDTLGRVVMPPVATCGSVTPVCNRLPICEGALNGYCDMHGREVIPMKYSRTSSFNPQGFAYVMEGDKGFLIDTNGNVIRQLPAGQGWMRGKYLELYPDEYNSGRVLLIDAHGDTAAWYDDIDEAEYPDNDAPHLLSVEKEGKVGFADQNLNLLVPCRYKSGYVYGENMYVELDNGYLAHIDRKGKVLFSGPYRDIEALGNGWYFVNRTFLMDRWGNTTATESQLADVQRRFDKMMSKDNQVEPAGKVSLQSLPEVAEDADTSMVFVMAEEMPEFPGGVDSLSAFLVRNIQYPQEAKENKIEGHVYVQFVVEKDGEVSHIRVLRDIGGGCGEEVQRVLRLMPRWTPGKERGKPIRCLFTLPVNFSSEE